MAELKIIRNFYIRDTLVSAEKFNNLPVEQRQAILELKAEFEKSGYIDARTAIGPSQSARQTARQRKQITKTASRVFEIENKIKSLLLTPEEKQALAYKQRKTDLQKRIDALERSLKTAEQFDYRRINSPRNNASKRAYLEQKEEKLKLEAELMSIS